MSLIELDRKLIWHPFTQAKTASAPLLFKKGEGAHLYTEDNEKYLDAISSWWVNLHGHAHPEIAKAIAEQAYLLEQALFTDFTHKHAVNFASHLLPHLPKGLTRIFYSDNGSTAVETALKMAFQFWYNQNPKTKKTKVISFKNGYHGDTFGAMSVSGKTAFNTPFWPLLFETLSIDPPFVGQEQKSLDQLEKILQRDDIACFIYEPLVQGSGGMKIHSKEGLSALLALCKKRDVLLIADEVMTGFGRTGPLFASPYPPDLLCLAKGITGGFLPLGATICSETIYNAFLSDKREKALLHGHSYSGNPISLAAACASLKLTTSTQCEKQRLQIAKKHRLFCEKWRGVTALNRLESLGTLLVLEYKTKEHSSYTNPLRDKLYKWFIKNKILIRPLGNVLYILPPYCIEDESLDNIYKTIQETFSYV